MTKPHIFERRVEFRDTDAAGIVHFSVFFTCMEQAEHELFRAIGLSVMMEHEGANISWPRVSAHCDYSGSFRFEQTMRIETGIEKIGNSSLHLLFRFFRDSQELAVGRLTTVCCMIDQHPPKSIPIPDRIRGKLAPYVIA